MHHYFSTFSIYLQILIKLFQEVIDYPLILNLDLVLLIEIFYIKNFAKIINSRLFN